jgi:hypothetical protein
VPRIASDQGADMRDHRLRRRRRARSLQQCLEFKRLIEEGDCCLLFEDVKGCARASGAALRLWPASQRVAVMQLSSRLLLAATHGRAAEQGAPKNTLNAARAELEQIVAALRSRAEQDSLGADLYNYGKSLLHSALTAEARLLFATAAQLRPQDDKIRRRLQLIRDMDQLLNLGTDAFAA